MALSVEDGTWQALSGGLRRFRARAGARSARGLCERGGRSARARFAGSGSQPRCAGTAQRPRACSGSASESGTRRGRRGSLARSADRRSRARTPGSRARPVALPANRAPPRTARRPAPRRAKAAHHLVEDRPERVALARRIGRRRHLLGLSPLTTCPGALRWPSIQPCTAACSTASKRSLGSPVLKMPLGRSAVAGRWG